jgi:acyl-CoA dehydrogenase
MNELTQILTETAERLLADHAGKETVKAAADGQWPEALWATLEENGLTQPLVPEQQGGIGAGWEDAFVIALAAGRHRAPVPLPETIAAGWLLAAAGISVPPGPIALADDLDAVAWGAAAPHAVAVSPDGGSWQVQLLAREGADAATDLSLAGEPRDRMRYGSAIALGALPLGAGNDAVSPLRLLGAAMRAAQIAGAAGRAIEFAVDHAMTRRQFGRPIAKFQAIQQTLARAAAHAAEARMAAHVAFRALEDGDLMRAEFAVASAKVVASEAADVITDSVHQVHGAIGFTEEHELHFTTRRMWSWQVEFGASGYWAERLGRAVLARGAANLWPDVVGANITVPPGTAPAT